MNRNNEIIKTSITAIIVNTILVGFKMVVGLLSHSIAIVNDAINNLTDALSSTVTIVGTKIAGKMPDKKHPFGYGQVENLTSITIAVMVFVAGFTALREALNKITNPDDTVYSLPMMAVIVAAIITKLLLGRYVKNKGVKLFSEALIVSGTDAMYDSLISAGTLVAAIARYFWNWKIEAYVGVLISALIIKTSIEMLMNSLSEIIGRRIDTTLSSHIKDEISAYEEVRGVYDLILNRYGPEHIIGSVHIEVSDDMPAYKIHALSNQITAKIYAEHGIVLTVGIYASNSNSQEAVELKQYISELIRKYSEILQMHGFYFDEGAKLVVFDIIIDFACNRKNEIKEEILADLTARYPSLEFHINIDADYSD